MKLRKFPLILSAVAGLALVANAVPAKRGNRVVSQPDGTTLTIHVIGDESRHYTLTDDNMLVVFDDDGQYSYARFNESGELISTKIRALDSNVRPASHANFVQCIDEIDIDSIESVATAKPLKASVIRKTTAYNSLGKFTSTFPTKGSVRGLVILAEYSDKSFSSDAYKKMGYSGANQYFTDMLNARGFSKNKGTGSAKDYFEEMSDGQFTPTFDVYGPYTLPKTRSYYGSDDDLHAAEMIMTACQLADGDVNFSNYDFDGDGYVDNVFVFYAYTGEASSGVDDDIWPHQSTLSDMSSYDSGVSMIRCDGVFVNRYACSNELQENRSTPVGIGTFVHEFSHVMGLPDLYHTTNSAAATYTPGNYSVLDYGPYNNDGRTPPAYGAYERNAMGWIDLDEFDGSDTYTLENLVTSNHAYVVSTSDEKEFFLFENRQQTGWDKYIPNHGMLIWHIDAKTQYYYDKNITNNTQSHPCVTIVKANNQDSDDSSHEIAMGWTWPGTSGNTAFSATTTPSFKDWQNKSSDKALTNISENDGIISFDVTMPLTIPKPDAEDLITKGDDYFYASWKEARGATDYKLWVYSVYNPGEEDLEIYTADMGSGTSLTLPDGWEKSTNVKSNTTASNCGKSIPAAKLSNNGDYVQTCEYDGNISSITFWYKGVNSGVGSYLNVLGYVDAAWLTIAQVELKANTSGTETITDVPSGVKKVKFEFSKSSGSVSLDDIVLTTLPDVRYEVLPDYDGVLTGGNISYRVDNLIEGWNTYAFRVAATEDNKNFTDKSVYRNVTLGEATGVRGITTGTNNGMQVMINNRTVSIVTDAERVDVFNVMGLHVSSVRVSDGQAVVDMPTAGMYVVRAGNVSTKVVVR